MSAPTEYTIQQPIIVKYMGTSNNGIQSHPQSRYAIGYILRGTKFVYRGDHCERLTKGDVFYMGVGCHYTEDVPDENNKFEQITFYYSPEDLQKILLLLSVTYGLNIVNEETCSKCNNNSELAIISWEKLRSFFINTNNYLRDENYLRDMTVEHIKLTELVCLIVSSKDCCIKSRLMSNIDCEKQSFEQVIYDNIFKNVSLAELSSLTNRSLTSFKKTFMKYYDMSPHKWYIKMRLMHSKLLLISTSKSIAEIGVECTFPNTSHFIKLFKREYDTTPATHRARYIQYSKNRDHSQLESVNV